MIHPEDAANPALRAIERFFSWSRDAGRLDRLGRASTNGATRVIFVLIDDDHLDVASLLIDDGCQQFGEFDGSSESWNDQAESWHGRGSLLELLLKANSLTVHDAIKLLQSSCVPACRRNARDLGESRTCSNGLAPYGFECSGGLSIGSLSYGATLAHPFFACGRKPSARRVGRHWPTIETSLTDSGGSLRRRAFRGRSPPGFPL